MRERMARARERVTGAWRSIVEGGDPEARRRVVFLRPRGSRLEAWWRGLRQVRLSSSLLNLAWTAGPVTGLGLAGGYYIAYEQPPPAPLIIYFVTFTVLTGLIGLVVRIVQQSTVGVRRERAQQDVQRAIDRLGESILAARDLQVSSLEGDARAAESARQMLRRTGLSAGGMAVACRELGLDRPLTRALVNIDHYQRAGLFSRIRDINDAYGESFNAAYRRLQGVHPRAAEILRLRFLGQAPRMRTGMPRDSGMMERMSAAQEAASPMLLTIGDVEDMLTTGFELLNGREIPILTFSYGGNQRLGRLGQALEDLERARNRYLVAQAASDNRIRALAAHLMEAGEMSADIQVESAAVEVLLSRSYQAMQLLVGRIDQLLLERGRSTDPRTEEQLRRAAETMGTALWFYRSARDALENLGEVHEELLHACDYWESLAKPEDGEPERLHVGSVHRGLRLSEHRVSLDEPAREAVAAHLLGFLGERATEPLHGEEAASRTASRADPWALDGRAARQLAIEMAVALEPHIGLERPEIQRGLATSRASYLGDLQPGMSATEKQRLGEDMARNVENDLGRNAEQLALALVRYYGLELPEQAQAMLRETYGARPEVLSTISRMERITQQMAPYNLLRGRPTPIPRLPWKWYRTMARARLALG